MLAFRCVCRLDLGLGLVGHLKVWIEEQVVWVPLAVVDRVRALLDCRVRLVFARAVCCGTGCYLVRTLVALLGMVTVGCLVFVTHFFNTVASAYLFK